MHKLNVTKLKTAVLFNEAAVLIAKVYHKL